MPNTEEKREVKDGLATLRKPMTYKQALAYGKKTMPQDLKAAGFECIIFTSDPAIHGSKFFRVNFARVH